MHCSLAHARAVAFRSSEAARQCTASVLRLLQKQAQINRNLYNFVALSVCYCTINCVGDIDAVMSFDDACHWDDAGRKKEFSLELHAQKCAACIQIY